MDERPAPKPGTLARRLGLAHLVLYGLGVTIGAGIYALVGNAIGLAGDYAPFAFVLAAAVMLLPAACFAELTGRLPFTPAEAHFVRAGFGSERLFKVVGLGLALVGIVSAAAIAHGAAGYLSELVDASHSTLLAGVIGLTGAVACLRIRSSTGLAGLLTVIEVGGLLLIVGAGLHSGYDLGGQAVRAVPLTLSPAVWSGIFASSLLAFFAFIGFQDIGAIAEETVEPQVTLPRGIFLTVAVTTALYLAVILTALASGPRDELVNSSAPLALVFARATGLPSTILTAIAVFATVNGIIVQLIMSGRVIFGLAREGALPRALAVVLPATGTPVFATLLATGLVFLLALTFPIMRLAEWTSAITLLVFTLVCLSLARIRARGDVAPPGTFLVRPWMPVAGALASATLLILGFVAT